MKSTGVIRRIDGLGRVVIPKEIRRNLKIRDGENLEIFIDLDSIILKKYSKLDDVQILSERMGALISEITSYEIIITDRDKIKTGYGANFEKLKGECLSYQLMEMIDNRENLFSKDIISINVTNEIKISGYFYIKPIISEADSIGLIILYSAEKNIESPQLIGDIISNLICKQVDID